MMTNDEIQALVDEIRSANRAYKCVPNYMGDAAADAIETLLAREAEVMEWADNNIPVSRYKREIRAILYPQPAALAEEKKKP